MSDFSENADDPGNSSDCKEEKKKKVRRRVSNRNTKKPKLNFYNETSDDSDYDFKPRTRNGNKKKTGQKKADEDDKGSMNDGIKAVNLKFPSGSFVISKTDIDNYDAENPPHIWRIDGKALLQKFEPFEEDGELKYRNTSIYTGWSPIESEKYAALQDIDVQTSSNQKTILTFDKNQLKDMESSETK